LAERGTAVRVATLAEPKTPEARAARAAWPGPVERFAEAAPAPTLVDALFGTGLARPLDPALSQRLCALAAAARLRVAVDLPSGAATDDGAILSPVPDFDLTIAFATLKPSHLLQPAARYMGRLVVADIGLHAASALSEIERPRLRAPGADDHKYSRGYVVVHSGAMPGAAALVASAALRANAGYVRIAGDDWVPGLPSAVVQTPGRPWRHLDDPRIDARAMGPGLGRGDEAWTSLSAALVSAAPLILDADALTLLAERGLDRLPRQPAAILTPHRGEFERLFPGLGGSKVEQARAAAAAAGAVLVYKGPDTVVADPDGRAAISPTGSAWLATAGTGDVLTGIVAAMRARDMDPFDAARAAVWLHGRAAELAGPGLVADDLVDHLPAALAECL
jgi:hydroxyethylthiazole kinase-like uncharacterized protein yjeF